MSFELRILSGLHRGAILPLSEGDTLTLGAHEDADVVLVDPGVEPRHAKLIWTESGGNVVAEEGAVYLADNPQAQAAITLTQGSLARIGPVWVGIFLESDKWQDPPASRPIATHDTVRETPAPHPAQRPQNPGAAARTARPGKAGNQPATAGKSKRRRFMLIAGAIIGMACVALAIAFTPRPLGAKPDIAHLPLRPAAVPVSPVKQVAAKGDPAETTSPTPPIPPPPPPPPMTSSAESPEALQSAFKAKLRDTDLLNRFDLELAPDAWTMRADLDDEEAGRFERLLKTFIAQHKITFPVNAKIVTAEGMLPFRIRQVTYGTNASIVTNDGERLYIGDELNGVRLIAVDTHKLTFAGKRKIEVNW